MRKKVQLKKTVQFRQWTNKRFAAFNSIHKSIKICTLAVAYSIVAAPVQTKAEGNDTIMLSTQELDDVVIQSTLIELKNAETGRSIEVIPAAKIQSLPVSSIDELLRYIPGIDAQQRGPAGTQTDFSLRGSNFNQVLVLIDGQKINDPLTAHFNSNIPISPSEIERIEIIRGAASLEYGSDATGGVINIISKTFSKNQISKGFSINAKALYGQYNQANTEGGLLYAAARYKIAVGGSLNKSDGQILQSGLKGYFDLRNVNTSFQYKLSENWSISSRYAYDFRDFNAQWFYTSSKIDKAIEQVTRHREQFLISREGENSSTHIAFSGNQTQDYFLFNPIIKANDNKSQLYTANAFHKISFWKNNSFLLGSNFESRIVKSYDRGNHEQQKIAFYATMSLKPLKSVNILAGLREELDNTYGSYLLPQISASYQIINPVTLRASVGRSVRTPDFTESFSNNFRTDTLGTGQNLGNPNLSVEKSWNYEAGFDIKPIPVWLINITGFLRKANGVIDYVNTSAEDTRVSGIKYRPNTFYWFAQNNVNTSSYGIETRTSFKLKISEDFNSHFNLGYIFLKHDLKKFENNSKYSILQPKHLFNLEMIQQYKIVSWSVLGIWKIRNPQANNALGHSLKAKYSIWNTGFDVLIYKKQLFVCLNINNVFNTSFSDFFGAEMPGRWFSGGFKFRM